MAEPKRTGASGPHSEQIRQLSTAEYLGAAQCMAEAFETDALSRYFVDVPDRPDWTEQDKWDLHLCIMQYITYAHCLKGIVTSIGPDNASVALWMPPGANMDDLKTVLQSGLWRLHYKLSPAGRRRFFHEFFPLLHDTKAAVLGARDPHAYYLVYIGTRRAARGHGYARALLDHMLARADAEARPVYLESTSVLNVPLYRRAGFAPVSRIALADGALPLDIMVREPRGLDGFPITARADSGIEMADGAGAGGAATHVKVHVKASAKKDGAAAPSAKGARGLVSLLRSAVGGRGSVVSA